MRFTLLIMIFVSGCVHTQAESPMRVVVVALRAPDAGWSLRITEIRDSARELLVVARLSHHPGPSAQVITTVNDQVGARLPDKPIKVYVAGKTWKWTGSEPYVYPASEAELAAAMGSAPVVFTR